MPNFKWLRAKTYLQIYNSKKVPNKFFSFHLFSSFHNNEKSYDTSEVPGRISRDF